MKSKSLVLSILLIAFAAFNLNAQMIILSGPDQGSNFQFVENINNFLGSDEGQLVINKSSGGSQDNFEQLIDPNSPVKLAFMQADILYLMKAKDMVDNTHKSYALKVALPMAIEEIHFFTKKSSGLKKLSDLDTSTVVAIGGKTMGTYATSQRIKDATRIFWSSRNVHFNEALKALAYDKVDVMVFVGSAPIPKLDLQPLMIRPDNMPTLIELENINGWANGFEKITFTPEMYQWLDKSIPGYGVRSLLVVNDAKLTDADREELAKLINTLKTGLEVLKSQGHPAWNEVDFSDWNDRDWPLYK